MMEKNFFSLSTSALCVIVMLLVTSKSFGWEANVYIRGVFPPFLLHNESCSAEGAVVELLEQAAKEANIFINWQSGLPESRLLEKPDYVARIRAPGLHFGVPVAKLATIQLGIMGMESKLIQPGQNLKNVKLAALRETAVNQLFIQYGVELVYVDDFTTAFKKLETKKVEGIIGFQRPLNFMRQSDPKGYQYRFVQFNSIEAWLYRKSTTGFSESLAQFESNLIRSLFENQLPILEDKYLALALKNKYRIDCVLNNPKSNDKK